MNFVKSIVGVQLSNVIRSVIHLYSRIIRGIKKEVCLPPSGALFGNRKVFIRTLFVVQKIACILHKATKKKGRQSFIFDIVASRGNIQNGQQTGTTSANSV
jgi:hypothetical protein